MRAKRVINTLVMAFLLHVDRALSFFLRFLRDIAVKTKYSDDPRK